jgi:protein-disulfide isomerase
MADLLFKNQEEWLLEEDFKIFDKYVSVLRLNKQEFNECINSEKSRGLIQELVDQGNNFGIAGTPTSFMNNEYLEGIFQKEDIVKVINEKLKE